MEKTNDTGKQMFNLIEMLYPICRSITGQGVRETLQIINEYIPLQIHEIPSGTKVFDWIVPKEWNIKDAYIKDSNGDKIVDFKNSNIHILNYSSPIRKTLSLPELKEHLFTLPEYPDSIPYLTTYYKENWGFCMSHNQFLKLKDDNYEVFIDSTLKNGSLTYGEFFLKGKIEDEVLLSTYVCHPSLCNDNLSGVSLLTILAKKMKDMKLKYSYRFLFIPETIGAITWLCLNEKKTPKVKQGLVATCLGDRGHSTYKKTKNGNEIIDRIVERVLQESGSQYKIIDFFPSGSDERQFSSPGFNLAIGSLMRTPYARFSQYHTSEDNLDFVKLEFLEDSFNKYYKIIELLEKEDSIERKEIEVKKPIKDELIYVNLNPKCEPQLGKRGLYRMIGGQKDENIDEISIFWILSLSDGINSLMDISNRSGIPYEKIKKTAELLSETQLLKLKV